MARASTPTGIANLTASLLKEDAIVKLDPPDTGRKFAKKARQWYDDVRREVLADHIWNFALKRVQLPASTEKPAFGYANKFLLPSDYIRVATIGDEDYPEKDYAIENGYILCNLEAPLNLKYVFDQEDVTTFAPKFVTLFSIKLAEYLAYDITGSKTVREEMGAAYLDKLSTASTIDGQESPPPKKIRTSRWKAARQSQSRLNSVYQGRVVE